MVQGNFKAAKKSKPALKKSQGSGKNLASKRNREEKKGGVIKNTKVNTTNTNDNHDRDDQTKTRQHH